MPSFKDVTERRKVPITEKEFRDFLESNVWLAICQRIRLEQDNIYRNIPGAPNIEMRALMYAHIDNLDEMLRIPAKIGEHNIYEESQEVKEEIVKNLKNELKGDIEQWNP